MDIMALFALGICVLPYHNMYLPSIKIILDEIK